MRHESLNYLFSSVTRVKGVGDSTGSALKRLLPIATAKDGGTMPIVRDLLFHLPIGMVDRRFTCPLNAAPEGVVITVVVTVVSHHPPEQRSFWRGGGKKPYKVICSNETGTLTLCFFSPREDYIKQTLPIGQKRVISGRTEFFEYRLQMTHPEIIATVDKLPEIQKPEPTYPLTLGLTSRRMSKSIHDALAKLPDLPEWIAPATVEAHHWPSWKKTLIKVHHPETPEDLAPLAPERQRLAYDEILANQMYLAMLRQKRQHQAAPVIAPEGKLADAVEASLPFQLTAGQKEVIAQIKSDIASGKRMGRLLQGDVGSGKTMVALMGMLAAVEAGYQAALVVPTEIIAQQHYQTISQLAAAHNVNVALLTGSIKGKVRDEVLENIETGVTDIIIGTHALFQEHVTFKKLAMVVIDEQHRFGVAQRMALMAKGDSPHLLHMTATPIPRSLTMTMYGDMESSLLHEKPPGRTPVTTRVIPLSRYDDMLSRLEAALEKGEKAYWICPLIEEKVTQGRIELTPETDIAAAEGRYTEFKARFGPVVGLVHGRMKADARNAEMQKFASGKTRLLVATTVVEVGVDVKDATIIVIEQAERFGLSQLHQLRGRVGRGDKPSVCVLLCSDRAGNEALNRLGVLRESEDGFRIAEADLTIRGGGDLLGTRQSGMPRFIFTDIIKHQELLEPARQEASDYLATDAALSQPRGQALRMLLQLFSFEVE